MSLRPGASARVAPLAAVAEVLPERRPESDQRVSVRVEVVASEPTAKSAAAATTPALASTSLTALESRARPRSATERAQLMAAGTAAVTYARGVAAYRDANEIFEANALKRGVCLRVRA